MFEKAIRNKYRFTTSRGLVSVEDLWDLPLSSSGNAPDLDTVAKDINRELKASEEESFVKQNRKNTVLETMLEIVKYIIDVKLAELNEKEQATIKKQQKEQIESLIAQKKNAALADKSIEELEAMLKD